MKTLLSFSISTILAVAFFAGCQQDSNSLNYPMSMSTQVTADAHPAWTFGSSKTVTITTKHTTTTTKYGTIAISDSDGTDLTNIYTGPGYPGTTVFNSAGSPTWSPSGGSISFIQNSVQNQNGTAIKIIDVSVIGGCSLGR